MKKGTIINLAIVVLIVAFAIIWVSQGSEAQVDEATAICIGEKAHLYVQLGCPHCKTQEDMFGKNLKYIERTDCYYERDACAIAQVSATPTWIIEGEEYRGVQSIETLKTLTGCFNTSVGAT